MNERDFLNQKRNAVEKMREMNARAQNGGRNAPQKPNRTDNRTQKAPPKQSGNPFSGLGIPFLDNITRDSDSAVILGLLLVLWSENADKRLLFALLYILL